MNAIGIDLTARSASAILCERSDDDGSAPRWRVIGDGRRAAVPLYVDGAGAWGSEALRNGRLCAGGDMEHFLNGLEKRVVRFLGGVAPVEKNYYRIVFAPEMDCRSFGSVQACLGSDTGDRSFRDGICIPRHRAALCRWLIENRSPDSAETTVVSIAVGDEQTSLAAYAVKGGGIDYASPAEVVNMGKAAWEDREVDNVISRNHLSDLPLERRMEILDSVAAHGMRMRLWTSQDPFFYTGPLRKRDSIILDQQDMMDSDEVRGLRMRLPDAVRRVLSALGRERSVDHFVVGGCSWPFVPDVLKQHFPSTPVWQALNPSEDICRGAALWPQVDCRAAILNDAEWLGSAPSAAVGEKEEEHSTPAFDKSWDKKSAPIPHGNIGYHPLKPRGPKPPLGNKP